MLSPLDASQMTHWSQDLRPLPRLGELGFGGVRLRNLAHKPCNTFWPALTSEHPYTNSRTWAPFLDLTKRSCKTTSPDIGCLISYEVSREQRLPTFHTVSRFTLRNFYLQPFSFLVLHLFGCTPNKKATSWEDTCLEYPEMLILPRPPPFLWNSHRWAFAEIPRQGLQTSMYVGNSSGACLKCRFLGPIPRDIYRGESLDCMH